MTQTVAVVVPIPHHALTLLLLQIGVLLAAALLLGRLARRLGMPSIVGELAAGVLLGPSLLAHVVPQVERGLFPQDAAQMHLLDAVGQFGVVLLVGFTGMHLDLKLVRRQGRRAAVVSAAGLVVPLLLGVWLGFALPGELRAEGADPTVFALFVGVAMCVSAIPVIARTLMDLKLIHRNIGQMILVAGTVDDAIGWILVSLITAMATTGLHSGEVTLALARMAMLLLFTMTVGRYVVHRVMRAATRSGTPGQAVTTAVVLIMLFAAGTQALELEAVFGAFLCGVLIGSSKDVDTSALTPLNATVIAVLAPSSSRRRDCAWISAPSSIRGSRRGDSRSSASPCWGSSPGPSSAGHSPG